ncbi:MAG: sugar transferase [Cyanobacteria bacterium]|nr:sugar transferase [Cyanobacteriota bacterium]
MNNFNTEKSLTTGSKIFYGFVLVINDLIFLALSCFLAYYLRFFTKIFGKSKPTYLVDNKYIFYSLIFIFIVILISSAIRLYSWNSIHKDPVYLFKIIGPPILGIIALIIFGRIYEKFPFSKIWVAVLVFLSVALLFASRLLIGIITNRILNWRGYPPGYMVIGVEENIEELKNMSRLRKKIIYGLILLVLDIIFLALAFYLSYYLRFKTGAIAELNTTYVIETNYIFYSIIFIASAVFIFFLFGLYDRDKIYKGSGYYTRILKSIAINIIVIIMAGYVFELFTFSRKWILLLFLFSILLIFLTRFLMELVIQKLVKKLDILPRTVIVGIGENAKRIEDSLKKYSVREDVILGHVDKKQRILNSSEYLKNFTVLGYLENLKGVINDNNIQRVIISSPEYKYYEILEILENLKGLDITTLIFPGFFEFSLKRLSVREIGGVPLMQVANIGFFGFNLFLKNFIDYVFGSIFFLFFIPIYLIVALLIKIDSKGPVFYKQLRLTKDSKPFYMFKFRTMYTNAEERLKELLQFNEASGPLFKMKNDPRITKVGRLLRKFSIDEIPQIINVLKGELSLVGPRPPLPKEVEQYEEWQLKRLNVKQGITGLWQISGRSELSFDEMTRLDLYYIQNWSIEMDVKIILRTIPAVLFGKGAY